MPTTPDERAEQADAAAQQAPLGVIAGAGRFPFMVVEGAKQAGRDVVVVALRGLADARLAGAADHFRWAGLARMGAWIRVLRRHGVRQAVLAGYVRKEVMYGRFRLLKLLPDWTSIRLWFLTVGDKRNDTVLSAVADALCDRGIVLQDVTRHCADALAAEGRIAGPPPSKQIEADIEFGWRIAKELGRLDIGQAVAVREMEVIAVEAIEGTDRMIERAGTLCPRGGWTLVKVAKPNQDMRFDVPTIGPETIQRLHRHGARALAVEAARTVIVDRQHVADLADAAGITILARSSVSRPDAEAPQTASA